MDEKILKGAMNRVGELVEDPKELEAFLKEMPEEFVGLFGLDAKPNQIEQRTVTVQTKSACDIHPALCDRKMSMSAEKHV